LDEKRIQRWFVGSIEVPVPAPMAYQLLFEFHQVRASRRYDFAEYLQIRYDDASMVQSWLT
jgi:hypothetical protein